MEKGAIPCREGGGSLQGPSLAVTSPEFYLHGDAAAALQVVAGVMRDGGCNGRRRAGLQAVAGTDELRQGLQGVDPQLNELALECKWAQWSAGGLEEGRLIR